LVLYFDCFFSKIVHVNVFLDVHLFLAYSKTCLNRTPLGLKNLFSLDRCLLYTGSNYTDI